MWIIIFIILITVIVISRYSADQMGKDIEDKKRKAKKIESFEIQCASILKQINNCDSAIWLELEVSKLIKNFHHSYKNQVSWPYFRKKSSAIWAEFFNKKELLKKGS